MKRFLLSLITGIVPLLSIAQNETQSYGKVTPEDLNLKECSFEKDAHAMVLFDKGDLYFDSEFNIVLEEHKRIKIFDDKAKDAGDVRIEFISGNRYEDVFDIQAHTINVVDGKQVITKLDKKQIFTEVIDKSYSAIVFSFPNVQPGAVLEYKYKLKSYGRFPAWFFQSVIPTRYTELRTAVPEMIVLKTHFRTHQQFYKNTSSSQARLGFTEDTKFYALKDVPSLRNEAFMTSQFDNLESVIHQVVQVKPMYGFVRTYNDSWKKVAETVCEDEDFGLQFRKKLSGEEILIDKAKKFASDKEKIAYLFNEVRNSMKWNKSDRWFTNDGTPKAWEKKTGNATEINLILYRLLKQSGVQNVRPLMVSTREHGKVNIAYPSLYQFNRTVLYIPVDSTKKYVLDASDKNNCYSVIPSEFLNSYGLAIEKETKSSESINIEETSPIRKSIFVNAEIKPEGLMSGSVNLSEFAYHKIKASKTYKLDGEEKFKENLFGKNNALKIKDFKIEGVDIDSIPLQESLNFELQLTGTDNNYIYFNPTSFMSINANPFLNENRVTTIDMSYNNKYSLVGSFKVPAGFKAEELPKTVTFVMPDKSISLQRIVNEAENQIYVRYILDFKKSVYTTDEYPALWQFYKQIFEIMNEQIVLKKS